MAAREFRLWRTPVKAAGDHEVNDKPEIAIDADSDALADAAELANGAAFDGGDGRVDCAQDEDALQTHALKSLAEDARHERSEVRGDVGQLGHCNQIAAEARRHATVFLPAYCRIVLSIRRVLPTQAATAKSAQGVAMATGLSVDQSTRAM